MRENAYNQLCTMLENASNTLERTSLEEKITLELVDYFYREIYGALKMAYWLGAFTPQEFHNMWDCIDAIRKGELSKYKIR